jgi:hypothetical protein
MGAALPVSAPYVRIAREPERRFNEYTPVETGRARGMKEVQWRIE